MIRIPCRVCGFELEVPQDLAGTEFQCPSCHLLNDIPTLHELKQINEDGTYVLGEEQTAHKPDRLAEMIFVYAKDKTDVHGNEIDLRGPIAGEDNSYKLADEPPAEMRPKYDPETGELIRPIDMAPNTAGERVDPASIPMAQPALGYATSAATRPLSTRSAFYHLLRPTNILVWMLVFLFHLAAWLMMVACGYLGYLIGVPFIFIFMVMLIAHWANVVDEVGREERDELPRPFRDMQWYDDLCQPFFAISLAWIVCYWPLDMAMTLISNEKIALMVCVPLGLIGTYFFPAVFLIAATSGTIVNLRPDRVWKTAMVSGGSYAMAVLLWTPAGILYYNMLLQMLRSGAPTFGMAPPWMQNWQGVAYVSALFVSVFLMHYFTWTLGLIYRENHANFPWAFQFHKRRREEGYGQARIQARTQKRQPGIQPKALKSIAKGAPAIPVPAAIPRPSAAIPPPALPQAVADQWPQIRE